MAKRTGKFKSFAIVLVPALLFQFSPAEASTAIDFPVFRFAFEWMGPARIAGPWNRLPDDRVAVETILLEAAGDGFESMVAVGEAIRNRTQLFNKTAREVCLQPKQFSGWNDRERAQAFLKEHSSYYKRAWLAWQLSAQSSLTSGATDYHTQDILPYWASAYTKSAQVGSHIFYIRQERRTRG
jgi:hypothetical protein